MGSWAKFLIQNKVQSLTLKVEFIDFRNNASRKATGRSGSGRHRLIHTSRQLMT